MKFNLTVQGVNYGVETSQAKSLSYFITNNTDTFEIILSGNNEWICKGYIHGGYPIPISEIGEAIQTHFQTHH